MSYPCLDYYENKAHGASDVMNILKDFPLYDFYNKLHSEVTQATTTEGKCSVCLTSFTMATEVGSELLKLCQKFCYILLNFDKKKNIYQNISTVDLCPFTSFWLYDQVTKITNFLSHSSNFYHTLQIIIKQSNSNIKDCSLENYKTDKIKFTNKKILYEFLHIYDGVKNKLDSEEDDSKIQLYCKHIKENFRFYNDVKDNCASEDSCGYFNELNDFKGKFSQKGELNYIYEKCKYKETTCNNGSYAEDDVPCLRAKGNPFILPLLGNDPDDIVNILLNVAIISVPIMAIFLILFKFTPFGGKLNRINAKRRKTGSKKKEENIEDYMNNYAAYVDNIMKNRVNVAYHAS